LEGSGRGSSRYGLDSAPARQLEGNIRARFHHCSSIGGQRPRELKASVLALILEVERAPVVGVDGRPEAAARPGGGQGRERELHDGGARCSARPHPPLLRARRGRHASNVLGSPANATGAFGRGVRCAAAEEVGARLSVADFFARAFALAGDVEVRTKCSHCASQILALRSENLGVQLHCFGSV
jgi:hypothetical protein